MTAVVDISNHESWGTGILSMIDGVLGQLEDTGWGEYPSDDLRGSNFDLEEQALRELLADSRLLSYHATRLLAHEADEIQHRSGLEILTEDLRARKILGAREHHPEAFDATDPAGSVLLRSGPNHWQGSADVRIGTIHFVAPYVAFDHQPHGFTNLLDTWGGETLGWLKGGRGSSRVSRRLTELSTPAIVEMAPRVSTLNTWRWLLPVFIGSRGAAPGKRWSEWFTTESVPAAFVFDVITPEAERWPDTLRKYAVPDEEPPG